MRRDKYSTKVYLDNCYIVYKNNMLITAGGDIDAVHSFCKLRNIKAPKRAWLQSIESTMSVETREMYALDQRTFRGYYNIVYGDEEEK